MAPRGSESGPSSSRRAARTRTDRSAAGRPPGDRDPGRLLRLAASPVFRVACIAAVAVLAAGLSVLLFLRTEPGNIDDGFILMVYIRHLIRDGTIAWNLGDGPVDGCTSMLDLLIKSAVVQLTEGDIVRCTFIVTAVFHVLVTLLPIAIILRLPAGSPNRRLVAAAAVGLMLASMESGAYAASFLLEMPLYVFCALGLAGLVVLTRRLSVLRMSSLVLASWMVALSRPEGLAPATVLLGAALWMGRCDQPLQRIFAAFGTFVAGMAIYQVWHFRHFGDWAPNAYYAKTSALRVNEIRDGVSYVVAFLSNPAGWVQLGPVLLSPLAILGSHWSSPRARLHYALFSWTAIGMLAVTVYAGGDSYPEGRLLTPSIALGAFAVAFAIVHAQRRLGTVFLVVAGFVVLFQCVQVIAVAPTQWGSHVWVTVPGVRACETAFGNALGRVVPHGTIAETDFQRLKFWCDDLRVVDLEGLSNREIAHQRVTDPVKLGKFRPVTVLRMRPEVWIAGFRFRSNTSRVSAKPHPLLTSAETQMQVLGYDQKTKAAEGEVAVELANLYVPASLKVCDTIYNLFVRKDLAKKFSEAGFLVAGI